MGVTIDSIDMDEESYPMSMFRQALRDVRNEIADYEHEMRQIQRKVDRLSRSAELLEQAIFHNEGKKRA